MPPRQSITVEYVVSGSLDGTTPAPPVVIDQSADDTTPFNATEQIYRVEVENLGLIDPDLGIGGSIGPRCIPFLWVDTSEPGAAGAALEVVGIRGDDAKLQDVVEDLAGKPGTYADDGFFVPQGSAIRLSGFTATPAEPIVVRLSIFTPRECSDFALGVLARKAADNGGGGGGGGLSGGVPDFSVNAAAVDGLYPDGSIVMRTGSRTQAAGAFNGGGAGNKSIFGAFGFDAVPLGDIASLEYVWENVDGPGGPFYIPPTGASVQTPYINLVVDFDPLGAGDIRILVTNDDSLNPLITASVGTYVNNGSNVLTYAWDDTKNVLIVLAPPNPVPGAVAPDVSVGASWLENSYKFSELVAANPDAVLVDAFTDDGGLPSSAITPAIMMGSGDSGNLVKSGKKILSFAVNGTNLLA